MPNIPKNPWAGFPIKAGAGGFLMISSAVLFLIHKFGNKDWMIFVAGGFIVMALVLIIWPLATWMFSRISRWRSSRAPRVAQPLAMQGTTQPGPIGNFNVDDFVDVVRAKNTAPAPEVSAENSVLIRKLQVLQDHPNTLEHERNAATLMLTRQTQTRRRKRGKGSL